MDNYKKKKKNTNGKTSLWKLFTSKRKQLI